MERYLVAFDMDGTLLPIGSSWEFVHEILGTLEEALRYREMYEKGEISYRRWAELDVSAWRDKSLSAVFEEIDKLKPIRGAEESVKRLKDEGFIVGLISSGVNIVADKLCDRLGMDFCRAAKLNVIGDRVLGIIEELDPRRKADELERAASRFNVRLERVAFVGDGESDLSIFQMKIGKKIAYRPKSDLIRSLADHVVYDLPEAVDILIGWKRSGGH